MREPYNSSLFVGRTELLDKIETWANAPNPALRLWSIVAPPGTGKSWLIQAVRDRLEANDQHLLFWLDLSRPADLTSWLQDCVRKAKVVCSDLVRSYDASIPIAAGIDSFVRDLCENCYLEFPPILVIDSFEQITLERRQKEWEYNVFSRFLGRECTRILLTRRDDLSLSDLHLRVNEHIEWLSLLDQTNNEGQQQLHKLNTRTNNALDLQQLISSVPVYKWNHPFINRFLFEEALRNNGVLSKSQLKACIHDLVAPQSLSKATLTWLETLALLQDEWTLTDLRSLGSGLNDPALNELFNAGIILSVPPRYKIADGIQELVRAWMQMRDQEGY